MVGSQTVEYWRGHKVWGSGGHKVWGNGGHKMWGSVGHSVE